MTPKRTLDTVFDGIALLALASEGLGEYYDTVLAGIAKMRECDVSVVNTTISGHLKHLNDLASFLATQGEIAAIFGEPNEDQVAKIETLQKPTKDKYVNYCVTKLALSDTQAVSLMDKMVARGRTN